MYVNPLGAVMDVLFKYVWRLDSGANKSEFFIQPNLVWVQIPAFTDKASGRCTGRMEDRLIIE